MSDKAFVDTNVLIYAQDLDAGAKHEAAKDLLRAGNARRKARQQHRITVPQTSAPGG